MTDPAESRRGGRRWVVLAAAAALFGAYYGWWLPTHLREPDDRIWIRDFTVYYNAASDLRAGRPLYVQTLRPSRHPPLVWMTGGYFYPPAFAVAFEPLARLPFRQAWWIWRGICEAALLGGIACIVVLACGRFEGGVFLRWWVVALALPLVWRSERIGQLDALLLLLVTAGMLAVTRRRDALAGLLFGAAAVCKLYPGLVLVYFALRRRWACVSCAALAFGVANAGAIHAAGWGPHRVYLTMVLPLLSEPTVKTDNVSFYAVVAQLLIAGKFADALLPAPAWLLGLHLAYAAGIAALVAWAWRDAPRQTPRQATLAATAGAVAAVLLPRLCWSIYFCLLLLPAALLWEWAPDLARRRAARLRALLLAAGVLLWVGTALIYNTPVGLPFTSILPLAAAWLVFGATLWAARQPLPEPG